MLGFRFYAIVAAAAVLFILLGCSRQQNPMQPPVATGNTQSIQPADSAHQLWGLWHVEIDPATCTANAVPVRGAMFTCNVTRFMQPPIAPTNMVTFSVKSGSDPSTGYFIVDISLHHPFAGLNYFNGFDVRGIFMTDGSIVGSHDPSVIFAGPNDSRLLNPDGYTRFWNPTEFTNFGSLFGFTKGNLALPIEPDSIVNPYKYFADNLGSEDSVAGLDPANRGIFKAGSVNTRRYEIRFKTSGGKPIFDFNYAIDASWAAPDTSFAPLYPPEAFDISANVQEPFFMAASDDGSTAYYVDPDTKGGVFKFDLEIFDRQGNVNTGGVPGEISAIWIESNALASPINILPSAKISAGSTVISSVFETDLTDLNLTSNGTVQFLVTVESADPNTYEPAVNGGSAFAHPDTPLAGYFTFTGTISDTAPAQKWPTEPVLIDPDNPVVGTHFAIDYNGIVHALYLNKNNIYWSYSSDYGNTWTNKGIIYTPDPGLQVFRNEMAMTADGGHVYCLFSEWDGDGGTVYTKLSTGRLNASDLDSGWEFKMIWQHSDGYSAEQNYSGLQIAVDNQGNVMVYAMIYNYASFISRYTYVPNWDSLTGAPEYTISPANGTLVYYYPQTTVALVPDSEGNFFMCAGGNFQDSGNYNGGGWDYGCFVLQYTPSLGSWRFVQSMSHPGGSFYWNSWAAGLAVGADDKLYWVNGYQHDNCGYYGLQGGYFVLSYGTGQSTGDHDFYFDDPINDFHNAYAECDLGYDYYGYDLMFVSSSIGVDPSNNVVITYQRSMNNTHVYAIRNDGAGWSDPPVQIDGGLLGQNPYGRMHPDGWFLVTFTDADYLGNGSGLPYFVAWK